MEALTPLSDISTSSGEQSEPLDLRKKNDCSFKSPPIKKNKYWFCQSEPLDLSVGEYENIEPSLNALHLESYNSFTFPENSQLNFSIACQQTFLSDQCTANSKCSCELYSCGLLPFDLSSKENKAKAREENKVNGESIVLPVIQSHLYVGDNTAVGGSILDSTELLSVESHQNSSDKEPDEKKLKLEICVPPQNLATKLNATQLKKTHESFLQDGKCFEVAPKLPRCRECSLTLQDSLKKQHSDPGNILCRFYAFRKLRYSAKGFVATAGFLDPYLDSTKEDLSLWQPLSDMLLPDLNIQMAKFMITHVGDQFCNLYQQEEEAISIHMSEDKKAAWKRPVTGYREMCDVCNTTLFNTHWTCRTCGFAVCIDCYKTRKGCMPEGMAAVERPWLICVNKRAHDQEKLMLTQIIAADSFKQLRQKVHDIRISLGLPLYCCGYPSSCKNSSSQFISFTKEFASKEIPHSNDGLDENEANKEEQYLRDKLPNSHDNSSTTFSKSDCAVSFKDFCSDKESNIMFFNSLKIRLTKPHLQNSTLCHFPSTKNSTVAYEVWINMITDENVEKEAMLTVFDQVSVSDANVSINPRYKRRRVMPTRISTLTESSLLYPDCPHSWLCEGRLLKLSDASHPGNYRAFQDQWKRGQPVLVSGVLEFLDKDLWQPDSFIRDFGDTKNDLVNCMTGRVIAGHYMRTFWEGFQEMAKMLKDDKGKPMLLKLKDWPPGEDFAEMLPLRFENLMNALPMGEYTKRTGHLNLPSRLPSSFARPDLGPKMYIAYGSAIHPTKGTTNLHLDISDAVNVMVYVGIPKDIDREEFINEAYRAVDEACCEMLMRRRVREPSEVPGALWHIYSARDAERIRHLLTRVAKERRIKLGPHQDPIHDQNWYLDTSLRERLYREYNVRGYAIVQCLGDAVFIPAGAPHQVRNLLNCIKVAEDFVSPENVSHCLHLTQEFRKLSDLHSNHEDKLQIKNIIYHAVKDSVSVLSQ